MTVGAMVLICKLAIVLCVIILLVPVCMIAYALIQSFRIERHIRKQQEEYAKQDPFPCEQDLSVSPFEKTNP